MTHPARFPDIEIYVMDISVESILNWISSYMNVTRSPKRQGGVIKLQGEIEPHIIPITITPGAAGKKFISIIFDSGETPWASDIDCAREAYKYFATEIRCSASGWVEEEKEDAPDLWWKINAEGEIKISWNR